MAAERPPQTRSAVVHFAMAGSEMAGFTLAGVLFDVILGTLPWITVGLTLFGTVVGLWHLSLLVRQKAEPPPPKDGPASG